jgi:hypothetical protein
LIFNSKSYYLENFSALNLDWHSSSLITNVHFNLNSKIDVLDVNKIIDNFQVQAVQLYISKFSYLLNEFNLKDLSSVYLLSVELIIDDLELFNEECYLDILNKNPKLRRIFVSNYSANKVLSGKNENGDVFFMKHLNLEGKKNLHSFAVNIELYSESLHFNTYLNRKIYIGESFEIKNSFESNNNFGYFNSVDTLNDIIKSEDYQRLWNVNKNLCDVCKDCEFRHFCIDTRTPNLRFKNEWFFLKNCNYNPYISKWSHEEGYKTLAECGVISNEHEFSIDHEKIALINKELWENE